MDPDLIEATVDLDLPPDVIVHPRRVKGVRE
jgi:hypothetical protein